MADFPKADAVCDGGDLDCGSGLLLIIKKSMDPLETGQVLDIRSRERSVAEDLPAWCRMVNHDFLGVQPFDGFTSYFVRKKGNETALNEELIAAKGYKWSVRVRGGEGLTAKVYSRNHTFLTGQSADFGAKVEAPSAVDYLLASLGSCITVGLKSNASRAGITIDAVEFTLKGGLDNVLYHLGIEETGSPALSKVTGTLYVTSPDNEQRLKECWEKTLQRSPVYQTMKKAVEIELKMEIVF